MGYIHQIPPLRAQRTREKWDRVWELEIMVKTKKEDPLNAYEKNSLEVIDLVQCSIHRVYTSLHHGLCAYSMASSLFFLNGIPEHAGGWLVSFASSSFFLICWPVLSNFNVVIFILSYYIIFCILKISEWVNVNLATKTYVSNRLVILPSRGGKISFL